MHGAQSHVCLLTAIPNARILTFLLRAGAARAQAYVQYTISICASRTPMTSSMGFTGRRGRTPVCYVQMATGLALAAAATSFVTANAACPDVCVESYLATNGGLCVAACLPEECGGGGDFCGDLDTRVRQTLYSDTSCTNVRVNDGVSDVYLPAGCNENSDDYDYADELSFEHHSNEVTCIDNKPVRVYYANSDCTGESTALALDNRFEDAMGGECIEGYGTSVKFTCPSITAPARSYSAAGERCRGTSDCEGDYICAMESGCDVGVCADAHVLSDTGRSGCNTIEVYGRICRTGLVCEEKPYKSPGEGVCRFPFEDYHDVTQCDPSSELESSAAGAAAPVMAGTVAVALAATMGALAVRI